MKKNNMPIIGLILGIALVIWSITMSGDILNFVDFPSIVITILGSFCALMISFPLKALKRVPKLLKALLNPPKDHRKALVIQFTDLARKARKDGLLALEDDIRQIDDELLVSGMQMVVDGVEPETIEEIMRLKLDAIEQRHRVGQKVFIKWGELAPAFGMIGTLIGLILMLSQLDDPSTIGTGMATALLTTFYGALLANLVFIPVASNLGEQTDEEVFTGEMIIEGVLSIQAGNNPRILEEKLITYLSSAEQASLKQESEMSGAGSNE